MMTHQGESWAYFFGCSAAVKMCNECIFHSRREWEMHSLHTFPLSPTHLQYQDQFAIGQSHQHWSQVAVTFRCDRHAALKHKQCYDAGIIQCMRPANERWRYIVTSSLIGWAHTRNDPCISTVKKSWKSNSKFSWEQNTIFKLMMITLQVEIINDWIKYKRGTHQFSLHYAPRGQWVNIPEDLPWQHQTLQTRAPGQDQTGIQHDMEAWKPVNFNQNYRFTIPFLFQTVLKLTDSILINVYEKTKTKKLDKL